MDPATATAIGAGVTAGTKFTANAIKDRKARKGSARRQRNMQSAMDEAMGYMPGMSQSELYGRAEDAWDRYAEDYRDRTGQYPDPNEREQWMHNWVQERHDPLRQEQAQYFGESTADEWQADPYYGKKHKQALESLYGSAKGMGGSADNVGRVAGQFEDIYEAGGLDDMTRAENEMMRQRYLSDEKAQRDAVLQRMYERGLGGSGAELAGQLAGQQSSANAQYLASLQNLAAGQARAQNALGQAGQLYGQQGSMYGQQGGLYNAASQGAMAGRGQTFYESATRGAATDDMNRYNTDYQRGVQQRNTDRQNDERWGQANMRTTYAMNDTGRDATKKSERKRQYENFGY